MPCARACAHPAYTERMAAQPPRLPDDLRVILQASFFIRVSHRGRRTGAARVLETTYVWDGVDRIYLSGYPGRRDWVANMYADPDVTVHTVEGRGWYDIPARARVLRRREERMGHVLDFIARWAARGRGPGVLLRLGLGAVRLNRALHLPWWGPFYLVRRVLDRMPCVELVLVGEPTAHPEPPPAPTGRHRP